MTNMPNNINRISDQFVFHQMEGIWQNKDLCDLRYCKEEDQWDVKDMGYPVATCAKVFAIGGEWDVADNTVSAWQIL